MNTKSDSSPLTMDLGRNIQANDQGLFVVTFFNKREQDVTEATLKYVFSKFGQLADIKYSEHGRVFISYKEEEGAYKALEIMNMGTKYHVETDWQPVKKIKTVQSTKSEKEDPFIYLRIPRKNPHFERAEEMKSYIKKTLFSFEEKSKIKYIDSSWVFFWYAKIVFDSMLSKDEILKRHEKNPLKWPKDVGNFEFCDDVPIAYIRCPKPNMSDSDAFHHVRKAILGNDMNGKIDVHIGKNNCKSIIKVAIGNSNYKSIMKVIFDSKSTQEEVMEAHKRKTFRWPENLGVFEFLDISEVLTMCGRQPDINDLSRQPVKKNEIMQRPSTSFQNNETNSNKNQQNPKIGHHNNGNFLTSNFNPAFYNFKEHSESNYGDRCQFDGAAAKYADSKYKTKLCQNYWGFGFCAYGPSCRFTHGDVKELETINNHQLAINNNNNEEIVTSHDPNANSCDVKDSDLNPDAKPFQIMKNIGLLNPNAKPYRKK